jgi:hypothetical protein
LSCIRGFLVAAVNARIAPFRGFGLGFRVFESCLAMCFMQAKNCAFSIAKFRWVNAKFPEVIFCTLYQGGTSLDRKIMSGRSQPEWYTLVLPLM